MGTKSKALIKYLEDMILFSSNRIEYLKNQAFKSDLALTYVEGLEAGYKRSLEMVKLLYGDSDESDR